MHFAVEERKSKIFQLFPPPSHLLRSESFCYPVLQCREQASLGYPAMAKGQSAEPPATWGCAPFHVPQIRGTKGGAMESTLYSTARLIPIHLLLLTLLASLSLEVHLWPWHSSLLA